MGEGRWGREGGRLNHVTCVYCSIVIAKPAVVRLKSTDVEVAREKRLHSCADA